MSFVVAIDGPAAAGKGTISKAVASHFGFAHLDSGLLYRAVAKRVLAGENPVVAARALGPSDLNENALRTAEIAKAASQVAADPQVRAALVEFQRRFAAQPGCAVIDGRDIGTVICPDADVKLFVTASDEIRALRRYQELKGRGFDTTPKQVLEDIRARDARDANRDVAPMKPAEDAIILDTSDLTIEQAVARAIDIIASRLAAKDKAGPA